MSKTVKFKRKHLELVSRYKTVVAKGQKSLPAASFAKKANDLTLEQLVTSRVFVKNISGTTPTYSKGYNYFFMCELIDRKRS